MTNRILDMKTVSDDGKWIVSTVELTGTREVLDSFLNPGYLADTYETMVFASDGTGSIGNFADRYRCGYSEIIEAQIGHEIAVTALNAGQLDLN